MRITLKSRNPFAARTIQQLCHHRSRLLKIFQLPSIYFPRIDTFEGSLAQAEQRDRDRMVALRQTIRQTFTTAGGSQESVDVDGIIAELDLAHSSVDEGEKRWDSYRNSFTLLMSKGYLQTVDQLRDKLLATEWEFGVRPISLQL